MSDAFLVGAVAGILVIGIIYWTIHMFKKQNNYAEDLLSELRKIREALEKRK